MPDLDKLYQEMKEKGVGVVGMVIDSVGEDGTTDEDTVKKSADSQGKNRSYLSTSDSRDAGNMNGRTAVSAASRNPSL